MKISVILPVYNVEKYLSVCLESLRNQTYKNLEFICVNDCSTDMSEKILNHYAKIDQRFIIINNNKNVGSGISRNIGLSIAKGDFVHFLDPDDWIELDTYEKLAKNIEKNPNIDVIRFTLETFNEINRMYENSESIPEDLEDKVFEVFREPKCIYYCSTSACVKLINRKILGNYNIKFNSYKSQEDIEFSIKLLLANPEVLFLNKPFLKYRINRKNSLTSKRILHIDSLLKDVKYVNEISNNLSEEIGNQLKNVIYEIFVLNCVDAYYSNKLSYKYMKNLLRNYVDITILQVNDNKNKSFAYGLCKKVLQMNHFEFFLSYNIRRFIRKHFPTYTEQYIRIKELL